MFDRFVAVDWSASSRPKRGVDSIWIAVGDGDTVDAPVNASTRAAAIDELTECCAGSGRVLLVVDWSLGYPAGSSAAFGLPGHATSPWWAMHDHLARSIADGSDNANNRFDVADDLNARTGDAGPFWGVPARAVTPTLPVRKKPFGDVAEWRLAEQRLRAARRWPKSCWQLGGAGSVGSQSLLGIARLAELRARLEPARSFAIWPFETGLQEPDDQTDVVVAEMWPSLFADPADLPDHWIRDAAQVDAAVGALCAATADGRLAEWFSPAVGSDDAISSVVGEEGWILGVR